MFCFFVWLQIEHNESRVRSHFVIMEFSKQKSSRGLAMTVQLCGLSWSQSSGQAEHNKWKSVFDANLLSIVVCRAAEGQMGITSNTGVALGCTEERVSLRPVEGILLVCTMQWVLIGKWSDWSRVSVVVCTRSLWFVCLATHGQYPE